MLRAKSEIEVRPRPHRYAPLNLHRAHPAAALFIRRPGGEARPGGQVGRFNNGRGGESYTLITRITLMVYRGERPKVIAQPPGDRAGRG